MEGPWDLSKVDYDAVENREPPLYLGLMNEPPGARSSVALSGLTVAEYFVTTTPKANRHPVL